MKIDEISKIRSANSNRETVMSSNDRYDSKVNRIMTSLKTGWSDGMNLKSSINSNFSNRKVFSQIESAVVDMAIFIATESD